jgi:hypothetical protein
MEEDDKCRPGVARSRNYDGYFLFFFFQLKKNDEIVLFFFFVCGRKINKNEVAHHSQ